jgi:hypothetical protein
MIKSRRMRWVGHSQGRGEVFTWFLLGVPNGRDHWVDQGIGGRITFRWLELREVGIDGAN